MAKKKQAATKPTIPKVDKEYLDLAEEPGVIDTSLELNTIRLAGLRWNVNLHVASTLPRSYHLYTIKMFFDRRPTGDRIDEIERSLNDSLFSSDRAERKKLEERVSKMRNEMEQQARECDATEFNATVETLKYKDSGTSLDVRVPDDVIEWFNRHKHHMQLYRVLLVPIFDGKK